MARSAPARGRARAPYNWLAPLRPIALQRLARQQVRQADAPLIAQLNRQRSAGAQTIQQYTTALAQALAQDAGQTQTNYAQAQAAQKGVEDALWAHLMGAGTQSADALQAKLDQAGIAVPVADQARTNAAGAANAAQATGASGLTRLIGQGAAAVNYANQLPGIAGLGGAQRIGQYGAQVQSQIGDLIAKEPGQMADAVNQLRAQEFQKAIANQSGLVNTAKLQQNAAYQNARLGQSQQSINLRADQNRVANLYKAAGLKISQAQLGLATQREQRLQRGKQGKTKNAFTPSQISKYRATAIDTVKDWKHGVPQVTDASGNVKSPAIPPNPNPRSAFRYLVNHGIPPSVADWAVGQVYGKWKAPGERQKRGPTGAGPR